MSTIADRLSEIEQRAKAARQSDPLGKIAFSAFSLTAPETVERLCEALRAALIAADELKNARLAPARIQIHGNLIAEVAAILARP